MENIPAAVNGHLDCIQFNNAGGLLLASSSLTNRYWSGSLWYFSRADAAPDVELCDAGVELEAGITDARWLTDNSNQVILGSDSGGVMLWELTDEMRTFTCLKQSVEHDDFVTCIDVSQDSKKAVSASQDKVIKIWDLKELCAINTYRAHYDTVSCVACHPTDPNIFLSTSQDNRILEWDLRKAKPASLLETKHLPSRPTSVSWQPNKEHSIVIGTESGHIVVQDTRLTAADPVIIPVHTRLVHKLSFAPHKPQWVASVSEDCTAAVTDITDGKHKVIYRNQKHCDFVRGLSWHPRTHDLYTCGWDFKVTGCPVPEAEALASPLASTLVIETGSSVLNESAEGMDQTDAGSS